MKNEKKGAGKPAPKGDTTQKRRQSRRRERLNEIAKALGFASWSAYETACLNGVAKPNNSVQPTIESGRVLPAKKSNRKGSAPAVSG